MSTETRTDTAEYAAQRVEDWKAFTAGAGPGADHWAVWAQTSHDWRQSIEFVQPVGFEAPSLLEPLQPLLDTLAGFEEIDLPPVEFLHLTVLRLGFLMSTDIMWSQVETFYVNAAPRIHRVPPFNVRLRGISAREDALYLGLEDNHSFREIRRQIKLGVPKAADVMKRDPAVSSDGDRYIPTIDFAYFTGRGDRRRVIEAVEPYLDADLGERPITHVKMGRVSSDPDIHYPAVDVVAEIGLLGDDYRKGYHN